VAKDHTAEEGINIREGIYAKTIMEVGNPDDLGLYLKAAPYQILKRGGLGDWALFVQVFGNPLVDATWDGFDESQRIKLLEAINALGSGGAIVRPEGTNITLLENKSNANGDLQDKFMTFLNKEISKALLGSTETTESSNSSGYAQAETHAGQDERKNESDINFVRRVLNSRFIKILTTHGFDTAGGRFVIEGEDNELSVKESFDIQMRLFDKGLPIEDDFFYETYGIPKPANYDQIKKDQEAAKEAEAKAAQKVPAPGKAPMKKVSLSEEDSAKTFWEKLSSFFLSAPVPMTSGAGAMMTCCSETHLINLNDQELVDTNKIIRATAAAEGKGTMYPVLFYEYVTAYAKAFRAGWKGDRLVQLADFGIEYGGLDPKMNTAWEMNIFKFSTVKAAYESKEVNDLFRRSKSFSEFERAVKTMFGYKNKNWLITEYNTAYQTAEAASTYYRLMGQLNTFPYWSYKTIGDDRVRDSHRVLHDVILPANHPLWKKIFPPNGWGCRCYVVPRLASEVDPARVEQDIAYVTDFIKTDPEWVKARKSGFAVNRAEVQEVFTPNQQYSDNPNRVLSKILQMGAADWKMKEAKAIQAAKEIQWTPSEPKAIDELWDTYKVSDSIALINDYASRPVTMDKMLLAKANMGESTKYELIGVLDQVLMSPDEVWINDAGMGGLMDSWVYLKYYRNQTIRVVASLDDAGSLMITRYDGIHANPENSRRGLLIRR
jgi:SPP1 gp7 family putative phage head morphogenesis protein